MISYSYKVVKTDIDFKVMEVNYSSEGKQDLLVSIPLPSIEQDPVELIKEYAPTKYWSDLERIVIDVPVGFNGVHSPVEEIVKELTIDELSIKEKNNRKLLLTLSDWTQTSDIPKATKDLWVPYRQELRDITLQAGFPTNIIWPMQPE